MTTSPRCNITWIDDNGLARPCPVGKGILSPHVCTIALRIGAMTHPGLLQHICACGETRLVGSPEPRFPSAPNQPRTDPGDMHDDVMGKLNDIEALIRRERKRTRKLIREVRDLTDAVDTLTTETLARTAKLSPLDRLLTLKDSSVRVEGIFDAAAMEVFDAAMMEGLVDTRDWPPSFPLTFTVGDIATNTGPVPAVPHPHVNTLRDKNNDEWKRADNPSPRPADRWWIKVGAAPNTGSVGWTDMLIGYGPLRAASLALGGNSLNVVQVFHVQDPDPGVVAPQTLGHVVDIVGRVWTFLSNGEWRCGARALRSHYMGWQRLMTEHGPLRTLSLGESDTAPSLPATTDRVTWASYDTPEPRPEIPWVWDRAGMKWDRTPDGWRRDAVGGITLIWRDLIVRWGPLSNEPFAQRPDATA